VTLMRNCMAWHEDAIAEHERFGRSLEAIRHRRIIGQLMDQIDAIE